jgi:hypothetical protein
MPYRLPKNNEDIYKNLKEYTEKASVKTWLEDRLIMADKEWNSHLHSHRKPQLISHPCAPELSRTAHWKWWCTVTPHIAEVY